MSSKRRKLRVETVKKKVKGKVYTSVLLRCSYRQDGKVKHETLGNLTQLPPDVIDFMKRRLSGELDENAPQSSFEIVRSLPHGNVLAVLQTAKKLGLENLLASRPCRERDLIMALIVARVLSPRSKLSTTTALNAETAKHTLAEELELGEVDVHQLYAAMDWLVERQTRIENKLAKKHLKDGHLVLFDVSSSYYTGRKSPLIKHGYSRDHRRDRPQIVYGLLCDSDGRPIAIEVFPGNTADPPTFTQIVARARKRFGINRIVFVGDRGMITSARINEDLRGVEGLDWISALRTEGIRKLREAGAIQMSLFDKQDLAEVTSEHFPDERLVVCRNPALAEQRVRKREELLKATEEQARTDSTRDSAHTQSASWRAGDWPSRWQSDRQAQDGETLRPHDHRELIYLHSQRSTDSRRGRARWSLRCSQQRRQEADELRAGCRDLQESREGRACFSVHEDGRSVAASDLPSQRRPHSIARVYLHAGLLRRVAHAQTTTAPVVRRR